MSLFKFCPHCGIRLEIRIREDRKRPTCPSCGFTDYQNPAPAAGCVVFDEGRLLMVQRAHKPFVGDWTIPAGYCEWEENPSQTAVRELKEETGLDVKISGIFKIYNGHDDPRTNAILVLYFADIVGGKLRPADDAMRAAFFAREELPQNIAFEAHRQALIDLKTGYPEKFNKHAD